MSAVPTSMLAPTPTLTVPAQKPLRILYADDLRDLREVVRMALTREGHEIECVEDGLPALHRLAKDASAFDLLITDHHMPVMNGLELVKQVRSLPFRGKILVFSSELSAAVSEAYRALRVDFVLPKPVFPSVLRRTLTDLFGPAGSSGNLSVGR